MDCLLMMNRTITISLLVGVLIFVMWFGVSFFLIPKLTEVKVMPDPSVIPPVETHGAHPNRSLGQIVVNIRNDGTVTGNDLQVLETDEAIAEYISKCRDKFDSEGLTPKLHLRGAQEPMFKYSRRVIKIANEQNVTQVVFATYEVATSRASADVIDKSTVTQEEKFSDESATALQREIEEGRQNIENIGAFVEMERAKLEENPDYEQAFLLEALEEQKGIREKIEASEKRLKELSK
jgi:biopolymer transport protein ExbD